MALHANREEQWGGKQQKALVSRGAGGGVEQSHLCVGIPNEGPKKCYESQNSMGIRESIEGEPQASERVSKKGHSDLQLGRNIAQNPNPSQVNCVGQSPKRHTAQAESSPVKIEADNQRVIRKGLSAEITKVKETYSLVSLQQSSDIAGEEKVQQEKFSALTSGQKTEKHKQRGWEIEEGKRTKEGRGSQTGDKGSSFRISDRKSISGKVPRDTISSASVGVDGVEDRFFTGENSKSTTSPENGGLNGGNVCGDYNHAGRKSKPKFCPPSIQGETPRRLGFEVEEEDGACAGRSESVGAGSPGKSVGSKSTSFGRVRRNLPMTQEQQELGADQDHGATSGSGSTHGPGLELGRTKERLMGPDPVGASKSPRFHNRPILVGLKVSNVTCSKANNVGEENGLNQASVLPSMFPECNRASSRDSNNGEEVSNTHSRDEDVTREVLLQDDARCYKNRYVDNLNDLNDLSPSSRFSVFGRPLLPGDFSGLGGNTGYENMELMRMVGDEDRGRGWDYAGVTTVLGEESEAIDRRIKEAYQEPSEPTSYESWESSSLAKFSEFLGFSTKGFEMEILDLLRNLVAQQKKEKEKGNTSVSKSERELRRLKSTINYDGKQSNRGGGGDRDKGNIQVKLK